MPISTFLGGANASGAIGGGGDVTAEVEAHRIDTTDVHGIADTSALILSSDSRLSDARTPTAHTHPQSDVTDLDTALAAKQDAATAATDAELAAAIGPAWRMFPWAAGQFYSAYGGSSGTGAPGEGAAQTTPLWVPAGARLDQIGCEVVTTPGTTGAVVRLGVHAAGADGRASTTLLDAGTIDATSTGVKVIDLSATPFSFPSSGLYWLSATVQGGAGTRPTVRTVNQAVFPNVYLATSNFAQATIFAYSQSSVSGSLPPSLTPATIVTAAATRVFVRAV